MLRQRYPLFQYVGFEHTLVSWGLELRYHYKLSSHEFTPTLTIHGVTQEHLESLGQTRLDTLVFNLGLVEMLSYWKLACSPQIEVSAGRLDAEQRAWWRDLLINGMGEYFYSNQIDPRALDFVSIISPHQTSPSPKLNAPSAVPTSFLMLTSGGKDSAVCLDFLRRSEAKFNALLLNPLKAASDLAAHNGLQVPIVVRRVLDARMLELNAQGYLNGHTPFSALLAFLGKLVADLFGYGAVAVCNERSSDEHNLEYLGTPINHQYSKSFTFERSYRTYVECYLGGANYFSLLRPFHELQVVGLLSAEPGALSLFRSCNRAGKEGAWCGECPKCLSTYLLCAAFLAPGELKRVFGGDFFTRAACLETLKSLFGFEGRAKPFECVGSREELVAAAQLAKSRGNLERTPLGNFIEREILGAIDYTRLSSRLLRDWNSNNFVPADLADKLRALLGQFK